MRKLNKRKLNKPRSKQAIASDLSKRAKKTLKNTKKNVKIWKKNPRRIDIEGVDTPKRKVKRTSKPKTVRSKVVKKVKPKTVKKVKPKTVKKVKPKTVKKVKPVIKGKVINTKKVNSSIRQKKPKERKSTMENKTEITDRYHRALAAQSAYQNKHGFGLHLLKDPEYVAMRAELKTASDEYNRVQIKTVYSAEITPMKMTKQERDESIDKFKEMERKENKRMHELDMY